MPAVLERRRDLRAAAGVVVVVPEHGEDGHSRSRQASASTRACSGSPCVGEVAGEEDQVGVCLDGAERAHDAVAERLRAVEVARGGEADRGARPSDCTTPDAMFGERLPGYDASVGYTPSENLPQLIDTMKRACAAFDEAGVPAMLGGGLAAWARGGPPTDHDVDFYLREDDAQRALEALARRGCALDAAGGMASEGARRRCPRRPDLPRPPAGRSGTSTSSARRRWS